MDFSVINEVYPAGATASRSISIILSENGSLYDFPYTKFVSPISLKKAPFLIDFIEREYGINKSNQLILRSEDGKKLEPTATLEDYFQKDKTIYVYVTKGQRQEPAHDDFEIIGGLSLEKRWSESCTQILPSIYENRLGSNVRESLEPQVLNYYDDLMAMFADVKGEMNLLKEGSLKIKRQKNAEAVAKKSLVNYYIEKKKQFDETLDQQEAKIETFQQYIDNFDSYIEKLSKQEIDPQLGEDDKTYLIEYFDVEKLQKSKAVYEKNQAKIKQKAQEIKDEIVQYDNQLNDIEGAIEDKSGEIQMQLHEQENIFSDIQDTHLQALNSLIEETKGKPLPKDLGDFIKRESENMIPRLRTIYQTLREIRQGLDDYIKDNASKLKDLISDITNIRVIIKGKIYNKLKVFCSLVDKHEEGIFNLEIIEKFPWVYQQSLLEIKRRCTFKKDYLTVLGILENFGNSENRVRQEFLEMYQQYLPKLFCPFLSKTFPQLKFENIKRVIDQDLNISFHDASQNLNRSSNEADILKLLKNLNDNLESKETKNKELESYIDSLKEKAEKLEDQLKQKSLNVNNLRKLLGSTGFQEKIDDFLTSYKHRFIEKIEQVEKRVSEVQSEKISSFNKMLSQTQARREKDLQALARLEELERLREESEEKILALQALLKTRDESIKELLEKSEESQKSLTKLMEENKILLEEKKDAEEKISNLLKQEAELKESEKEKLKTIEGLQTEIENIKKEIETKEREIDDILQQSVNEERSGKESQEKVIADLKMVVKTLQDDLTNKEKELKENLEITKGLVKEKKDLKVALKKSQDDLEALKKEPEKLEKRVKELVTYNNQLGSTLEDTREELNLKITLLLEQEQDNKKLKEQAPKLNDKISKLTAEIQQLKDEYNKTLKLLEDEKAENAKKEKELTLTNTTLQNDLHTTLNKKDTEILQINNLLIEKDAEIEELRQNLLGSSIIGTTNKMLGELGTDILSFYQEVAGKDSFDRMKNKEFDLRDVLEDLKDLFRNSMAKIDDYSVGDKVIAVRIFDSNDFIVINKDLMKFNTVHLFKAQDKNLEDVIVGQLEAFGGYIEAAGNKALMKNVEAIIELKLSNVMPLCSIPITRSAKKAV